MDHLEHLKEQILQINQIQHKQVNIHEYIERNIVLTDQLHHLRKYENIFLNIREHNLMRI